MERRRFDHLLVEVSVAAGRALPRYALWRTLQEQGFQPERLSREAATSFCDERLAGFLAQHGVAIAPRHVRRLRRRLARFDPRFPTPQETFARIFAAPR